MGDRTPKSASLERRRLLELLAGGVAGGLAGCRGEAETGQDGKPIEDSSSVIGHSFQYVPENVNLNRWATGYASNLAALLFEYQVVSSPRGERRLTDLVADLAIDGREVTVTFDDGFTWWNGEPVTARDRWVGHRIDDHLGVSSGWSSVDLIEEYTLRYTFETPLRRRLAVQTVGGGFLDTASWLHGEWLERFRDASSGQEVDDVAADLQTESMSLEDVRDQGFGCGPYELQEVSANRIMLRRFDNHPAADEITVPRLWLPVARDEKLQRLIGDGLLDVGQGLIASSNRLSDSPEYVEQLDSYTADRGGKLALNWLAPHLGQRNVRRALVSVLPLGLVAENAGWSDPPEVQTGLSQVAARQWLGDSYEDLYGYPIERDDETAAAFMRRADYERQNGQWVGPDGEVASLFVESPQWGEWSLVGETLQGTLTDFGIDVEYETLSGASFGSRVQSGNYQLVTYWADSEPFDVYDVENEWPDGLGFGTTDPDAGEPNRGKPITPTIPAEPGALTVDGDGVTLNLVSLWNELARPISAERTREILGLFARWWNYDLPDVYLATWQTGIWGNTRDFEWPSGGAEAYRFAGPSNQADYHLIRTGAISPAN